MSTYNGWSNYETWCTHLWMTGNDASEYQYWLEIAEEHNDVYHLAEVIRDIWEENIDQYLENAPGLFRDLLRSSLSEVNWREIAESLKE